MASVELPGGVGDDDFLNRLRETVQNVMGTNLEADGKAVDQLVKRLADLKAKYETLSLSEKEKFSQQMQESFEKTISSLRDKVVEPEPFKQLFHWSILVYLGVVLTFALFGYKLYKSLMEKELKKQEKQKNNKKSKKIKQK